MSQHEEVMALRYPDRAESLQDFDRYRVFLDHWGPLISELSQMRRALYARGESRTLGIYAPQGSGKTLFARQLRQDIERRATEYDHENLWHRIAVDKLSDGTARVAAVTNLRVMLRDAGDDAEWSDELSSYLKSPENRAIVLLDEADQAYLKLRLLQMSMDQFLSTPDPARLLTASAEKFAKQCRTVWRGALFVMLSNRREFLSGFSDSVNGQHSGMMSVLDLPQADAETKEKVVRINTNRLNYFSYWYCINNATPTRKSAIYDALVGAGTFPGAFEAVDAAVSDAVQSIRTGRPAIKNSLTLCILHEQIDASILDAFGPSAKEFEDGDCRVLTWTEEWAARAMGVDLRQSARMLESEWNLRIVLVGPSLIGALLGATDAASVEAVRDTFTLLFEVPSPYAQPTTLSEIEQGRRKALNTLRSWNLSSPGTFWSAGQGRSYEYESALKRAFPAYNTGHFGVPGFRPDLTLHEYRGCSVLQAGTNDSGKITRNIRRDGNYVEFTAVRSIGKANVIDYLGGKLRNYVRLMESV